MGRGRTQNETPKKEDTPLLSQMSWLNEDDQDDDDASTRKGTPRDSNDDDSHLSDHRPIGHIIFAMINTVAVMASACMFFSQVITLVISNVDWIQGILRFYVILFCAMFVMAELEITLLSIVSSPKFLDDWTFRGFLYSFVGMIGVEESYSVQVPTHSSKGFALIVGKFASIFIKASSLTMFLIGGESFQNYFILLD